MVRTWSIPGHQQFYVVDEVTYDKAQSYLLFRTLTIPFDVKSQCAYGLTSHPKLITGQDSAIKYNSESTAKRKLEVFDFKWGVLSY